MVSFVIFSPHFSLFQNKVGKDYPEISFSEEILAGSFKLKGVDNLAVELDGS